jgi:hypothetical protein
VTVEDPVAAAIEAVPELRGAHSVKRLGGLTNANFKVESPAGERASARMIWVRRLTTATSEFSTRMAPPAGWLTVVAETVAGRLP